MRSGLELHHLHPFARGGAHTTDVLTVRCKAHNLHAAVLDFGEDRIAAAIARIRDQPAERYPVILELLEKGDLHLTAINMLAPHLTRENHAEVLASACGKSKRELELLVAALAPKPDAVTRLWRLADSAALEKRSAASKSPPRSGARAASGGAPSTSVDANAPRGPALAPLSAMSTPLFSVLGLPNATVAPSPPTKPASPASPTKASPQPVVRPSPKGTVAPLSPERFRLQVTLSRAGRDALLRAQELSRRDNPSRDLSVVLEKAICAYVEELERKQFAKRRRRHEPVSMNSENETACELGHAPGHAPGHVPARAPAHAPAHPPARVVPASDIACSTSPGPNASEPARESASRVQQQADSQSSATAERPHSKRSRHIPRAIRRAVFERDGFRCTFVGPGGRCSERSGLELHHLHPFARGGAHTTDVLTVRCKAHNLHAAVLDFGEDRIAVAIRRSRSQPAGT